jgi:CRP/FNR family cyclic AMP-dependent transcriptional regulator
MPVTKISQFDPARFLAASGVAHKTINVKRGYIFFAQGGNANSIFYLDAGRAKLTVLSKKGKEATVTLLSAGDFIGEESLAGLSRAHIATASAVGPCRALILSHTDMIRLLHEQHEFSDIFLKFVLRRGIRTQEDLIDQLFNNSEKRLARTLLIMAEFGQPGGPESVIPPITQAELADMIGTTRSRVSYFMNRFRRLGYVTYNGRIHVHKSLLDMVLRDKLPEQRVKMPATVLHSTKPATKKPFRPL